MAPPAFLVPSQVIQAQPKLAAVTSSAVTAASSNDTDATADMAPTSKSARNRRRNRKRAKSSFDKRSSSEARSAQVVANQDRERRAKQRLINQQKHPEQPPAAKQLKSFTPPHLQSGNLPDIYWRSIPMEHLRLHPNFEPLPEKVYHLKELEDVRLFRQSSWQWDALHTGRCTTSQAAAALGLLEPHAGKVLGVPLSWRKGGAHKALQAYHRLRSTAIRSLEEMNEKLCDETEDDDDDDDGGDQVMLNSDADDDGVTEDGERIWAIPRDDFRFVAKYNVKMDPETRTKRRNFAQRFNSERGRSVRMYWGDAQEATSVLTALNYFCKQQKGVVVKEVGMCGAGLPANGTAGENGLLVGASPDGVICYPNGTMEALEVKNHCPYVFSSYGDHPKKFRIRGKGFDPDSNSGVMPQYVPQLMMEIFCLGPTCTSAVMVRQTAINGALILRIRRDDEWIEEMMHWLNRFYNEFVLAKKQPPENFFFREDKESARYRKFLERTIQLEAKVEVVKRLSNSEVQRVMGPNDFFLDAP